MRHIYVRAGEEVVCLFRLDQIEVKRYPQGWRKIPNPFLEKSKSTRVTERIAVDPELAGPNLSQWNGQERRAGQYDQKLRQQAKDQHQCTQCGRTIAETQLEYHHEPAWKQSSRHKGTTLCVACHARATTAKEQTKREGTFGLH